VHQCVCVYVRVCAHVCVCVSFWDHNSCPPAVMWNVHVAHVITLQRLTAGKHTAHWTGDNFSDFDSMASSVRQIMNHNMFGIAFVGADICGFLGMSSFIACYTQFVYLVCCCTVTRPMRPVPDLTHAALSNTIE